MKEREEFARLYAQGEAACWEGFYALQKKVEDRDRLIVELNRRVGVNSTNSHFPPSRDFAKKKRNNSRVRSGRKPGGQPGHPGHTLPPMSVVDQVVPLKPEACGCGYCFTGNEPVVMVEKRQVIDIPQPRLTCTEFQTSTLACGACGEHCRAAFPPSVQAPVQYGEEVWQAALNLHVNNLVPVARSCTFIRDQYGAKLSPGTLHNMVARAAEKAGPVAEQIRRQVAVSDVVHFDETSSRVNSKTTWTHVASTKDLTAYFSHPKRGQEAMDAFGILPSFKGTAVHDHLASYYLFGGCSHHQCGAHLLRDCQSVFDAYGLEWAQEMKELLKTANETSKLAKNELLPEVPQSERERLVRIYHEILSKGRAQTPAPPPRTGKRGRSARGQANCLLDRFERDEPIILNFLYDTAIPFDNNQAERDIRMMKLKQKTSGCFRSQQGADNFCSIRSIISTLSKKALNIREGLSNLIRGAPLFGR